MYEPRRIELEQVILTLYEFTLNLNTPKIMLSELESANVQLNFDSFTHLKVVCLTKFDIIRYVRTR